MIFGPNFVTVTATFFPRPNSIKENSLIPSGSKMKEKEGEGDNWIPIQIAVLDQKEEEQAVSLKCRKCFRWKRIRKRK